MYCKIHIFVVQYYLMNAICINKEEMKNGKS